jgi:hypothetical protein
MSAHNVRDELAELDPSVVSEVEGEMLDERGTWGVTFLIRATATPATRVLPPPSSVDQRIRICLDSVPTSGQVYFAAPAGTTMNGSSTTLRVDKGNFAVLESFVLDGVLQWRVVAGTVAYGAA